MDHLATHYSREADPGLVKEEELANISQLSSFQSTQSADSSNSALDHVSGTSDDIPGDEDVGSITTFDEGYDARSETSSVSSLRTRKSSFCRIASASIESLDSFLSMVFAPPSGTHNMTIRQLAQYLQSKHRLSKTVILDMTTYHSQSVILITHMFVVLRVKQGHREGWIRLDRRAEDPFRVSFLFSGMRGPVKDEALSGSQLEDLITAPDVEVQSRIAFETPPSLRVLERLLVAIYEESKDYRLWPENCWFFCSLMQEHLFHRHGGYFASGELYRSTLGSDTRARISGRLNGMRLADSRVVSHPLTPLIGEANIPCNEWFRPRYLFFTPDGTRIIHGSVDGTIRVWDLSLRELIKITTEHISQLGDWARLLNDHIIVSGTSEESYNFWDIISGTPIRFCTASQGPEGLVYTRLASAPNDLTAQRWRIILRDANRWQGDPCVHNETHNRVPYISEESIFVDEKPSNTCVASLNVGLRPREDFLLSPSGNFISFRLPNLDDSYLWNIDTQTVYRLDKSLFHRMFFGREWSTDGHYIAIERSSDFTLWDTRTGALVSILNFGRAFRAAVLGSRVSDGRLCFSPDGRCFAAADGGRIRLWDMEIAVQYGPYRRNHPLSFRDGVLIV